MNSQLFNQRPPKGHPVILTRPEWGHREATAAMTDYRHRGNLGN